MKPNEQQQKVVDHVDGPCLVTAVPGSGKTTALTERIKNLVRLGKDPSTILAITFTRKAAKEMRSRISAAVGDDVAAKMIISTFHSFCARLLRSAPAVVGLTRDFTIYDEDGQERALKASIAKVEGEDFKVSNEYWHSLMGFIEGRRNSCMTEEHALDKYNLAGNQKKVVDEYFKFLLESNAIDYTGLLSETIRLLESSPETLARCHSRFQYISVDEVQDTNIAQYRIIQLLAGEKKNVLCVGDTDQSIFAFRNASPENVITFRDDFGARVLRLEKNYRSTPEILRHSQQLIEHNELRVGTVLATDNPSGQAPRAVWSKTEEEMATDIAEAAKNCINKGVPAHEIAVLYRTNFMSRAIEMAMRSKGLKCKVVGGTSFFDRKEVKAALSVLQFMANQTDRVSFERTVEQCCRGVGDRTLLSCAEAARASGRGLLDTAAGMSGHAGVILSGFVGTFRKALGMPPQDGLIYVCQQTSLWDRMERESTAGNDRCANMEELAADVGRWMEQGGSLSGYLQNVSLMTSDDEDVEHEIRLMTLHACKGLEFDIVMLSHCCQGMVPHKRVLEMDPGPERDRQIEEERRLFYVGMTRARKALRAFYCRNKRTRQGMEPFDPSQFLEEAGLL